MTRLSLPQLFQLIPVILLLLLNACLVESRRSRKKYSSRSPGGPLHTRGADPLPWWAITLVFVGGVMGLFFCVVCLRKIYEKKRQKKIRIMMSRRSANIQRRLSQHERENAAGGNEEHFDIERSGQCISVIAPPQIRADAPPTYEQSQHHDSLPPAYFKEVDTSDEHQSADATRSSRRDSVATATAAPPSYDVAQNDGSEVVEVGGAVSVVTSHVQQSTDNSNSAAVLQV